MNELARLKQELWSRFGTVEHPAEWDGIVYGGGKLSQRYWEYFRSIELLDLARDSVVLDIGGGSPKTGVAFFASLIATVAAKVIVVDPNSASGVRIPSNIELISSPASYSQMSNLFASRADITHVTSVSVFEHIEDETRQGLIRAINESFAGRTFVTTFEFHPNRTFFEHQLTARSMSKLFEGLTNFFPDEISASPVLGEIAFDDRRFKASGNLPEWMRSEGIIPCWYPVAVRFVRTTHVARSELSTGLTGESR